MLSHVVEPAVAQHFLVVYNVLLHQPDGFAVRHSPCHGSSAFASMFASPPPIMPAFLRFRRALRASRGVLGSFDVVASRPRLRANATRLLPAAGLQHHFPHTPAQLQLYALLTSVGASALESLCRHCREEWVLRVREDVLWISSPELRRLLASKLDHVHVRRCQQLGGTSDKLYLMTRRHALPVYASYALGVELDALRHPTLLHIKNKSAFFNSEMWLETILRHHGLTIEPSFATVDARALPDGGFCYCSAYYSPQCLEPSSPSSPVPSFVLTPCATESFSFLTCSTKGLCAVVGQQLSGEFIALKVATAAALVVATLATLGTVVYAAGRCRRVKSMRGRRDVCWLLR